MYVIPIWTGLDPIVLPNIYSMLALSLVASCSIHTRSPRMILNYGNGEEGFAAFTEGISSACKQQTPSDKGKSRGWPSPYDYGLHTWERRHSWSVAEMHAAPR